jgi:hypothetical protein
VLQDSLWDVRGHGSHGLWELASFAPNRPLLLENKAVMGTLVATLLPPVGASLLTEPNLQATEAAAAVIFLLAGVSEKALQQMVCCPVIGWLSPVLSCDWLAECCAVLCLAG